MMKERRDKVMLGVHLPLPSTLYQELQQEAYKRQLHIADYIVLRLLHDSREREMKRQRGIHAP